MSKARRTAVYDIRYTQCDIRHLSSFVKPGGGAFCENPSYQWHMPTQLVPWEYDPSALKCFAINRNHLMLLRIRCSCFVYFRSGRILFSLYSCVYLAVVQIFTAANTSEIIHKTASSRSIWDPLKRVKSRTCCLVLFSLIYLKFPSGIISFCRGTFWLLTSLTATIVFRFLVELQKKDKEKDK